MNKKVVYADAKVEITFSNEAKYVLTNDDTLVNYIESVNILEDFSTSASNPVGSVSSNSIKLVLSSDDDLLLATNTDSIYFGYMNNTAYIDVSITKLYFDDINIPDEVCDLAMGRFFVDKWTGGADVDTIHKITIEADDLMTSIKKSAVPVVAMKVNERLSVYVGRVLTELNAVEGRDIGYSIAFDALSFGEFDENCKYFSLDNTSMDSLLNQVSQATLTHMGMNRQNKVYTDYIFDDVVSQSVCDLDDDNLTSIQFEDSSLKSYSGVNVKYSVGRRQTDVEIASIDNQQIVDGTLELKGISMSDRVDKVTSVSVLGEKLKAPVNVDSFRYNNKYCDIDVISADNQTCDVKVFGATMSDTTKSTDSVYIDKTGEVLTIDNNVIATTLVNTFRDKILSLMQQKKSALTMTGYFNPEIKLGDLVTVTSEDLKIVNSVYKVLGLEIVIDGGYECKIDAIKTIV